MYKESDHLLVKREHLHVLVQSVDNVLPDPKCMYMQHKNYIVMYSMNLIKNFD